MEVCSELVRTILARRGVVDETAIAAFLNPEYEAHTHDPFLFFGMDVAVECVFRAMERGERIAIYADFDCDGIPGAAILSDLFEKIGYANVEVYLPHRDREGYGFHTDAITALASRGVSLIITVDVGTTAVDAVSYAKKLGVDVIVTDHHDIPGALPDAVAVLNPKISPYPFPYLCGAAVAFKLAQAILRDGKKRGDARFISIPDGWEKWLLDLVAIASVADMMPLLGENRALVHWGLRVLRKSQRPGITALCALARIRKSEITEDDIGFSIAPRVNAASRMDEPGLAFKLLTTKDAAEAQKIASQLEELNARRKGVVASIVKEARRRTKDRFAADESVVVLGSPEWKPALLGLAANSIMQDRGGVVCLWGRDVNGNLKGSCRSDGTLSITELFANAREIFEECGGHAASGGFSVSHERVHELQETLARAAAAVPVAAGAESPQGREHDLLVTLPEISWRMFEDVSRLAPFGAENKKPILKIVGATIFSVKRFGKEQNHVEVALAHSSMREQVRAFDFFRSPEDFSYEPHAGESASILATLERDSFRGPARLALRLVDILPA